ncbi:MGMT family protein [Candidatus Methanomassiliicoccus intestinalis]|uniref:Methylated DNA-protein cysteine methyltransferase n=1 Tax=Candidatus Methanomassiliicoccus intestinalis TaxID=1406512 RepID=A0A8J8PG63_9ARCH|nr:MAG: methylated DNA-protein cysteine methyltransferase [Candidatus Methanomassiliicoccus intestinalis]
MANEEKKDFNAMLRKNTDMPKTQIVTDESIIKRYGGERMFFAPPLAYDELMKKVPHGKVVTAEKIREYLAEKNCADFTDPMTAGLFISIAAWASHQREEDITPYWRTLKTDGELNAKYPGGIEAQKKMLEEEGHVIIQKGRKNIRFFVKDYENVLFDLH